MSHVCNSVRLRDWSELLRAGESTASIVPRVRPVQWRPIPHGLQLFLTFGAFLLRQNRLRAFLFARLLRLWLVCRSDGGDTQRTGSINRDLAVMDGGLQYRRQRALLDEPMITDVSLSVLSGLQRKSTHHRLAICFSVEERSSVNLALDELQAQGSSV